MPYLGIDAIRPNQQTDDLKQQVKSLWTAYARLTDRLQYVLNNLDDDNLSDGTKQKLSAAEQYMSSVDGLIKGVEDAFTHRLDRMTAQMDALQRNCYQIAQIHAGTVSIPTKNGGVSVNFSGYFTGAAAIVASAAQAGYAVSANTYSTTVDGSARVTGFSLTLTPPADETDPPAYVKVHYIVLPIGGGSYVQEEENG